MCLEFTGEGSFGAVLSQYFELKMGRERERGSAFRTPLFFLQLASVGPLPLLKIQVTHLLGTQNGSPFFVALCFWEIGRVATAVGLTCVAAHVASLRIGGGEGGGIGAEWWRR